MITQTPSFKTSDGKLYESRLAALIAERLIEVRGVIQSENKNLNLSATDAANIVIVNCDKLADINRRYKTMINRARVNFTQNS